MKNFLKLESDIPTTPYPLNEYMVLGSDQNCSLQLLYRNIEDRHCVIQKKGESFVIRDLRSKTGTYINNVSVLEAPLKEGDLLKLGDCSLRFISDTQAEPKGLSSKNAHWGLQLQKVQNISKSEFPVLLTGASGTGKEIMANQIHQGSDRKNGPFVSVNCSALTETLIESELFGHVKGSFTGAIRDRKGAFETARNGTLFLDEIGDLPLNVQAKLLRALENNEVRAVGSDVSIKTNARIIAATHHDLKRKIIEKEFRADLYYRLDVVQIKIPRLCERLEDFEDILNDLTKNTFVRFTEKAIDLLKSHLWPGNIRELKNAVSRASVIFPNQVIEHFQISNFVDIISNNSMDTNFEIEQRAIKQGHIREAEKQMILHQLKLNRGNQRKTARDLGMPKSTLHDKIRFYGFNIKDILDDLI
jgi:DNA-binding NtrC family response regulator